MALRACFFGFWGLTLDSKLTCGPRSCMLKGNVSVVPHDGQGI